MRAVVLVALTAAATAWAGPSEVYWHDDAARALATDAPHPAQFRALTLDTTGVAAYLKDAHLRGIATTISLPQPDGGFAEFMVTDSGTMPTEMQRKYPDIISLKGSDAQGRPVRLDVSPMGFQAMVFDPAGIWLVRPEVLGSGDRYLSFKRAELAIPDGAGTCEVHDSGIDPAGLNLMSPQPMTQTGVTHRVYRVAVAANNKYIAAVGGGTAVGGLAATITAVNRVTQVYEYEMSIQLTLVPNNDLIMYPTAATDPFAANGTGVINNSTSIISAAIGAANYDIGHVFTTGSGGVAGLGVVCGINSKARGTTGLSNPTGDSFYIDFVAHEMGHQFGGNHPFNGSLGNCSGGNRNGSTAYEPGSGTTIMSYAGICGADDLQPHSDPFFHAISLQEITNYTNGSGNCSANTTNSNQAPVINTASLPTGLTIPARTPFVLSATATDADGGDAVMYDWEEWDLGPQAPLTAGDNGTSPIFRSFPPSASGARMFPKPSTVLTGVFVPGEVLPTTNRTLKFRLTARDLRPGFGTSQSADVSLGVVNTAGPFKVTAPNTPVSWAQGSAQTVSWDVANTSAAPVSCSAVDISLSSDGGQTFVYTLASGVANSGSASVTVPAITSTQARVSVSCANNVFFDVSDANFTIPAGAGTYTVGGNLSGLAGSGLVLTLNGSTNLPVNANGSFTFPNALVTGNTYAITVGTQPVTPVQTCTVSNGSGTIAAANVTNVAVICTTPPPVLYSVGGTVSGLTGSGLALSLNGGTSLPITSSGSFTFPTQVFGGNPYSVVVATQPGGPAQTCTVANGSGTISANVSNVIVTCGALQTYTIGGTVSGLSGTGLTLKLNGGADLAISASGIFTFPTNLVSGDTYAVSIGTQPTTPTQTCTVANGSGTVGAANVTNVAVTCITPPTMATVGGTVTGLVGIGLKLKLNTGSNLLINADGPFAFTTQLSTGDSYTVVVVAQPSSPVQVCTVTNGSGTIGSTNVTNVAVTCAAGIDDTIFADGFEGTGGLTCAPLQLFQDPSFEATVNFSNPNWASFDSESNTSFCDDSCDDAATLVARTGSWFVWMGGWDVANTATLSQSVVFPAGQARWLNYWMINQIGGDATASLQLNIDGAPVQTMVPQSGSSAWTPQSLQIPAQYLDGQSHAVNFAWAASASNGDVGGALIDDVTLDCAQGTAHATPSRTPVPTSARKHPR